MDYFEERSKKFKKIKKILNHFEKRVYKKYIVQKSDGAVESFGNHLKSTSAFRFISKRIEFVVVYPREVDGLDMTKYLALGEYNAFGAFIYRDNEKQFLKALAENNIDAYVVRKKSYAANDMRPNKILHK